MTVRAAITLDVRDEGVRVATRVSWRVPLTPPPARYREAAWDPADDPAPCLATRSLAVGSAAQVLATHGRGSPEAMCARRRLLDWAGLAREDGHRAVWIALDGHARARVAVDRKQALVTTTADGWVNGDHHYIAGPFWIDVGDGGRRITVSASADDVPGGSTRIVVMHLHGLSDPRGTPVPKHRHGQTLQWRVGPSSRGTIAATADVPLGTTVLLAAHTGTLGAWVTAILGALLAMFGAVVAWRLTPGAWRVRSIILVALVVAVLALILDPLTQQLYTYADRHDDFDHILHVISGIDLAALGAALLLAAIVAPVMSRWKLATVLAGLLLLSLWLAFVGLVPARSLDAGIWLVVLRVATATLGLALLVRLALAWAPVLSRRALWALILIPAVVVLADTVQELLRARTPFADTDFGYAFDAPLTGLSDTFAAYPFSVSALTVVQQLSNLAPYAVLAAAIVALGTAAQTGNTLRSSEPTYALLALVFSVFVVGGGGQRWGLTFPLACLAAYFALLLARGALLGLRPDVDALSDNERRSKVTQALTIEHKRASDRDARAKWLRGDATQTSEPSPKASATDDKIRDQLLAAGPCSTWFDNGVQATRIGLGLAVAPVGYYAYVVLSHGLHAGGPGYTSASSVAFGLVHEVAFWLVAAFCFGAVLPLLPTAAGLTKGMLMAAVVIAVLGLGRVVLPAHDQVGLAFRAFELVLFLALLGLLLDLRTVGRGWRDLGALYRLNEIGPAIVYVAPLLGSAIVIAQQLRSGDASQAIQEAIQRAPGLVPPTPGGQ